LGYRREPRHQEVTHFYRNLRAQKVTAYTTDYVLDELITLLFRREIFDEALRFVEGIMAATTHGYLIIERITPMYFSTAWDLRRRYKDKIQISFTDLTSMVVMRELQIRQVLTSDEHFFQVGMGFQKVP